MSDRSTYIEYGFGIRPIVTLSNYDTAVMIDIVFQMQDDPKADFITEDEAKRIFEELPRKVMIDAIQSCFDTLSREDIHNYIKKNPNILTT